MANQKGPNYHGQLQQVPYTPYYTPPYARKVDIPSNPVVNGLGGPPRSVDTAHTTPVPAHGHLPVNAAHQQARAQPSMQAQTPAPFSKAPVTVAQASHLKQNVKKTSHTDYSAVRGPAHQPSFDHTSLLLALAEEYFEVAHSEALSNEDAGSISGKDSYFKLVATGLGCIETVLEKCTLKPEQEAVVRLRYATLLFEETEDMMEAEEALNKGISVADRHKLFDLKYNMQHLLVRILFERRGSAAFTFLDTIIKDAEAYQHLAWVYAFRFLDVSLHLENATHSRRDLKSALSMLKAIISTSERYTDVTIFALASILKAWVCLKGFNSEESLEDAQTSLASARSLQTSPLMFRLHQLSYLAAFVDLCCYLQHFDPLQCMEKMHVLEMAQKLSSDSQSWMADGSFYVPLRRERMAHCRRTDGVVRLADDGSLLLLFNWMPREDMYSVAYLLSGLAFAHKNSAEIYSKSEHLLQDGIKQALRMCNGPNYE